MRKQIRFKVKHIFATLGFTLVFVIISYLFLPSILLSIGNSYYSNGEHETAKVYFDRINQYFPNSGNTAEALERAADISNTSNLLMITPKSIGGVQGRINILSEEAESYYRELADRFPVTWQGRRAIAKLTSMEAVEAIGNQRIDDAVELTLAYYNSDNDTRSRPDVNVSIDIAHAMKMNGYYAEAIRILQHVLAREENTSFTDFHEMLGDLYSATGNKKEATYHYERVLAIHADMKVIEREYMDEDIYDGTLQFYAEKAESIQIKLARLDSSTEKIAPGSVTGTIRLHGNPLSDVQILLQPYTDPSSFPVGSMDALWVVSNHKGEFLFENVSPGEYGLGFAVYLDRVGDVILQGGGFPKSILSIEAGESHHWDFSLVDTLTVTSPINNAVIEQDAIEFSWEPFEGASYYTLKLGIYLENGSSYGRGPEDKYFANQASLTREELHSFQSGVSYNEDGPTPQSLFGYAMPGGQYFWGVDAHDEDGNILTSSRGYLVSQNTDFSFSETKIIEADQLLLDREYAKAIAAYEKLLEEDPYNQHGLRMLASMRELSIGEIFDYPYTDYKKAIHYYERLYKITGHTGYLDSISRLYYYSLDDYASALTTLEKLKNKHALSDWQRMELALVKAHFGDYEDGLQQVLEADQRFFRVEAALRALTGSTAVANFPGSDDSNSNTNLHWHSALRDYDANYTSAKTAELIKTINTMTAPEAISFLAGPELSANEAFIKLSLQMIEPSMRRDRGQYISAFIKSYASIDPNLTDIVKKLYSHDSL